MTRLRRGMRAICRFLPTWAVEGAPESRGGVVRERIIGFGSALHHCGGIGFRAAQDFGDQGDEFGLHCDMRWVAVVQHHHPKLRKLVLQRRSGWHGMSQDVDTGQDIEGEVRVASFLAKWLSFPYSQAPDRKGRRAALDGCIKVVMKP